MSQNKNSGNKLGEKTALIVTIQENEANFYEFTFDKMLHNSTVDNQNVTSYKEAKDNFNQPPTRGGDIVDGNEGQWKSDVNKSLLKDVFVHLSNIFLKGSSLHNLEHVLFLYSSNVPKHDLEKEIHDFTNSHSNLDITFGIENKNLHDHKHIEEEAKKFYS
jgi:hypothetical protein